MSEELILSPDDPEWMSRRREVYTASDMGVLFGLVGFGGRTISDVWYEKRYGRVQGVGNASTRLGTKLEPLILDEAENELGPIVDRQKWFRIDQIGATIDGRCERDGRPVEAKTSGILWKPDGQWGDGDDEVPDAIVLQVQAQILVVDSDMAYIPAMIGGRGYNLYRVERSDKLIDAMKIRVAAFWATIRDDNPPAIPPQLETLKCLKRVPNKVVSIDPDLVEEYRDVTASEKAESERREFVKRKIIAAMGNAEAAESPAGGFEYFEQVKKSHVVKESRFRVLSAKKV